MIRVAVLTFALAVRVGAQAGDEAPPPLPDRLDAAVRAHAEADFVGAVLVARGGRVLLRRGYGRADRKEVAATPTTLFDVASVSKQFTAAAVLRLEADGRLTTRDRLDRFFRDVPEDKAAIRLHELLTHTSGLPTDVPFTAEERQDRDRWLARVWRVPLSGEPGERFLYSNTGYGVLAAVVERAARSSFDSFVAREIFAPAGMRDTGFLQDPDLDGARAAVRFKRVGDERNGETAIEWPWHWSFKGATGVVTTVDDLYAWDRALRGDAVLPPIQRDKLLRPLRAGYAYGFEVTDTPRGTREQAHRGVTYGFESWCARYPDEDAFVCVLSNHGCRIGDLSDELERVLFEAGAPADVLAAATGSWRTPDGQELRVAAVDGRLSVRGAGGEVSTRVAHGTASPEGSAFRSAAFARHAERRVEDAGRRRRKTAFSAAATDAAVEVFETAWRAHVRAHGPFRRAEALCAGAGDAETWLRVTFGRTPTTWRARWGEDRGLVGLEPAAGPPPLPVVEMVWRRGRTFVGQSADGRREVRLTIAEDGASATWTDDDSERQRLVFAPSR